VIEQTLFLAAFFSFIWLVFLALFWLGTHSSGIRSEGESANRRLAAYTNKLSKTLFLIVSAYVLHPIIGIFVALSLILIFLIY